MQNFIRIPCCCPDSKWLEKYFGMKGLEPESFISIVQVGRQRGRQRKRWDDSIKEWTGLEWNIILRKAENSEEWRKLVVKSTVVAQQSARRLDR